MRHATPQFAMQRRNAPCNAAMRHATPQCAMQHYNAPCNTQRAPRSVQTGSMTLPHAVIAQPHAAAQQRRRSRSRSRSRSTRS
jgi:hypothetical protein